MSHFEIRLSFDSLTSILYRFSFCWFVFYIVHFVYFQCILFLVVIYSWVHIALQIREKRKEFFKEFWNYYEMLTTLMATVSIGMYIGCVVEATNTFNLFLANQTGFTNFERVAYVHAGTRYLQAWLLFLLMYKVITDLNCNIIQYIVIKINLFFWLDTVSYQCLRSPICNNPLKIRNLNAMNYYVDKAILRINKI